MRALILALALAAAAPAAMAETPSLFSTETFSTGAGECPTSVAVVNIVDRPYQNANNRNPAEVIETALNRRGYRITARSPGSIEAFYAARDVRADLTVTYTDSTYSITYRSSENMNFANGRIHPNYNRWVNNLDHDFQAEFAALPPTPGTVPTP